MGRADASLRPFVRSLHAAGLAFFVVDGCAYALAVAGTVVAPELWQKLLCALAAGFCTSGLLIVAHDACHQSLTPSRWLNRVIGTLAFLPALHAYSLWRHGHNFLHHLHTNQRGMDYAWEPLSPPEYARLSAWARLRYRFYRTLVGHYFYYPVEIWWWRRFIPHRLHLGQIRAIHWVDSLIVMAWLLALGTALVAGTSLWTEGSLLDLRAWPAPLCLGIGLPFLVSGMLQSNSTFLHHTHPEVHWFKPDSQLKWQQRQLETSVHVQFPPPVDWFLHWIMDHPAHHLLPTIPLYQLRPAEDALEANTGRIVTYRFSLPELQRILGACKLYDLEAGCWTDYSGRPTSETRFTGSISESTRRAA